MGGGDLTGIQNIGANDKERGCHQGAHGNQRREELSAILTHNLGKSLRDACFDHYHFMARAVQYERARVAGRRWLCSCKRAFCPLKF